MTAVVLFYVCALIAIGSMIFCYMIYDYWGIFPGKNTTYYETTVYKDRIYDLMDMAVDVDIVYENEKNIENGGALDREMIIEGFKKYYNIADGVITSSTEINEDMNDVLIQKDIPEELKDNFEEYRDLVQNRLPKFARMCRNDQLSDYKEKRRILNSTGNFRYCITDENGIRIAGNTSLEEVKAMENLIIADGTFSSSSKSFYEYSNEKINSNKCILYAATTGLLAPGDTFFEEEHSFELSQNMTPIFGISILISVFFGLILFCYLLYVAGKTQKNGTIQLMAFDKIFNDLQTIFVIGVSCFSYYLGKDILYMVFWSDRMNKYFWVTAFSVLIIVIITVLLTYILSIVRQIRAKRVFKNTVCNTVLCKIASFFSEKTYQGWMVSIQFLFGVGNIILGGHLMYMIRGGYSKTQIILFGILVIVLNFFACFFLYRNLKSLQQIMHAAKETSQGNLKHKLDLSKISPSLINFATDVQKIQNGFEIAVDEAVKGERMKSELITNVSHDLKTPLTSIVTYVDLLKNEHLQNERAESYVDVLADKAARLKQLVEDLVEASKASSGNLAVEKVRLDFGALLEQAIGEFQERFDAANLDVKLNIKSPVFIEADGNHMWRILENLITNIIKYSISGSRVYADLTKNERMGILILKNISAQPISINPDLLTERFVRGDSSRTMEGAGLGLSIAESLTKLQNGVMKIDVDGDLFKVRVMMPLSFEIPGLEEL